jgi:hypothetical protein
MRAAAMPYRIKGVATVIQAGIRLMTCIAHVNQ